MFLTWLSSVGIGREKWFFPQKLLGSVGRGSTSARVAWILQPSGLHRCGCHGGIFSESRLGKSDWTVMKWLKAMVCCWLPWRIFFRMGFDGKTEGTGYILVKSYSQKLHDIQAFWVHKFTLWSTSCQSALTFLAVPHYFWMCQPPIDLQNLLMIHLPTSTSFQFICGVRKQGFWRVFDPSTDCFNGFLEASARFGQVRTRWLIPPLFLRGYPPYFRWLTLDIAILSCSLFSFCGLFSNFCQVSVWKQVALQFTVQSTLSL